MSKQATEFQKKAMSKIYRGKAIFKPLNTCWIDENVACIREYVANIFFYRKNGTTGGADIFLDYFMLIIQDYVCTLPGSYSREIFLFVLCYTNQYSC